MELILNVLIFCIVLFLYTHIYFHLKTSDDLELYEIDKPSKVKLEEICDLRQPVLFDFENDRMLDSCKKQSIIDSYGAFDVKIRNVKMEISEDDELYVPISFISAKKAMDEDVDEKYLVENNSDFLEETGIVKTFRHNDLFLRPYMVSNCLYDYITGSNGTSTPLRYDINYRNYYLVSEGTVRFKLSPPRSEKYLYIHKDYENLEFRSPLNVWNIQPQYRTNYDKIKCLDIVVNKGQILFIPAYWLYTMKFENGSSVCSFKYRTYMNTVAIFPQLFMRFLQTGNVERNVVLNKSLNKDGPSEYIVNVEKINPEKDDRDKIENSKKENKTKIEDLILENNINVSNELDDNTTTIDRLPIVLK